MSNRKAFVLLVILLLLLLVSAYLGNSRQQKESTVSSSYSAFPRGLKALYLYWSESGTRVNRWNEDFVQMPQGDHRLFIISEPSEEPITATESLSLMNWVHHGNDLIVASRCGEESLRLPLDSELLQTLHINCGHRQPNWQEELLPGRIDLHPTYSVPMNKGLRRVSSRKISLQQMHLPEGTILLQAEDQPVAELLQHGSGWILFLATSSVMENSEINRQDNLQLVSNFVQFSDPTEIVFDEYHHGFQRTLSSLSAERLRALSWTSLQLIGLLVLFVVAGGKRLGPPRQDLRRKGRSAMETIESLAFLFLKGKKYHYLGVSLQQDFIAALSKKYHLAKDLSNWNEFVESIRVEDGDLNGLKAILQFQLSSKLRDKDFLLFAANVDFWRDKLRL